MTDVNDIAEIFDNGNLRENEIGSQNNKGESGKESFAEETDFEEQTNVQSLKAYGGLEEPTNGESSGGESERGKNSDGVKAKALADGIIETQGPVEVPPCDDSTELNTTPGIPNPSCQANESPSENTSSLPDANGESGAKGHGITETQGPVAVPVRDDSTACAGPKEVQASSAGNPQLPLRDSPHAGYLNEGLQVYLNEGCDNSNVLDDAQDIEIQTMNRVAFLLKGQFCCSEGMLLPEFLYGHARFGGTAQIQKVGRDTNVVQIHYLENHYLVSAQFSGNIHVYDSLNNDEHLESVVSQLRPQLNLLYENTESIQPPVVLQSQEESRLCGCFAAANAYKLLELQQNNLIPTQTHFIKSQMRQHLHSCLELNLMRPFPEATDTLQNTVGSLAVVRDLETRNSASVQENVSFDEVQPLPPASIILSQLSEQAVIFSEQNITDSSDLQMSKKAFIYNESIFDMSSVRTKDYLTALNNLETCFTSFSLEFVESTIIYIRRLSRETEDRLFKLINSYAKPVLVKKNKDVAPCYIASVCTLAEFQKRHVFVVSGEDIVQSLKTLCNSRFITITSWWDVQNIFSPETPLNTNFLLPNAENSELIESFCMQPSKVGFAAFTELIFSETRGIILVDLDNIIKFFDTWSQPTDGNICIIFCNGIAFGQFTKTGRFPFSRSNDKINIAPLSVTKKNASDINIIQVATYLNAFLSQKTTSVQSIYIISRDKIFRHFQQEVSKNKSNLKVSICILCPTEEHYEKKVQQLFLAKQRGNNKK